MTSCERIDELLDDHLDGRLEPDARASLEAHLQACPRCAASAAALQALLRQARALPREAAPARDLWPGIAARAAAGRDAGGSGWPARGRSWLLAAAAVLLLAGGAVLGMLAGRSRPLAPAAARDAATGDPRAARAMEAFGPTERDLDHAAAALRAALEARRARIAPDTLEVLDDNLRVIDQAIGRIKAALGRDPQDRELVTLLAAIYQRKIDLLGTAMELSRS